MLHTSTTGGPLEDTAIKTTRHRMKRNDFRLENGAGLTIEYWLDPTAVNVAAFDADGRQASVAVYQAHVDAAEHFTSQVQEALIDSLANALEYDLINKPEVCLRKHFVS